MDFIIQFAIFMPTLLVGVCLGYFIGAKEKPKEIVTKIIRAVNHQPLGAVQRPRAEDQESKEIKDTKEAMARTFEELNI